MKEKLLTIEDVKDNIKNIEEGNEFLEQARDLDKFIRYWRKELKDTPHLKIYDEYLSVTLSLSEKIIKTLETELQRLLKIIKEEY